MKVLSAASLLAVLCACPGPMAAPEVIERELPAQEAPPGRDAGEDENAGIDAGAPDFDAGVCCTVEYALAARSTEVAARLIIGDDARVYAMTQTNDVWRVSVCTRLVDSFYYFETDAPANEDAGLAVEERVNESVQTTEGGFIGTINLFSTAGATTCETFDAGVYATVAP